MEPIEKTIAGQPSWIIRSDQVELAVARLGGHMAPVTFYRGSGRPVQPYHISPWQTEGQKVPVPVLVPLRGDFFCAPFGNPSVFRGRDYPAHGESACFAWRLAGAEKEGAVTSLTLRMRTRIAPGTVTKRLLLIDGHNVVYSQHVLEGFSGPMTIGHHATLAMPARERSMKVTTSPIRFGMTNPTPPGDPAGGDYFSMAVNRRFRTLAGVPMNWKDRPFDDASEFPARRGFCDLYAVFNRPGPIAWTAASFEDDGFVWFSLKDPAVQPATMFWAENHGRHSAPWNGRNCCLGLEDICAFLSEGLAASAAPNSLSRAGVPTTVRLSPDRPMAVNYIQGVVKVPRGFGRVRTLRFSPGRVTFESAAGRKVAAELCHEFIQTGRLSRR
ncbi:MAG: hypothetical protein ACE15C_01850 [Phycisphaerae bacterium]